MSAVQTLFFVLLVPLLGLWLIWGNCDKKWGKIGITAVFVLCYLTAFLRFFEMWRHFPQGRDRDYLMNFALSGIFLPAIAIWLTWTFCDKSWSKVAISLMFLMVYVSTLVTLAFFEILQKLAEQIKAQTTANSTAHKEGFETCSSNPPSFLQEKCPDGSLICDASTRHRWVCDAQCPELTPETVPECEAPICNIATGYQWICEPRCAPFPPPDLERSCTTRPICGTETDYAWTCATRPDSPLCGANYKPGCNAVCQKQTDGKYDWRCIRDLSRAELLRLYDLHVRRVPMQPTGEAEKETIEVVYADAAFTHPILPTTEYIKDSKSLGTAVDALVQNPDGFVDAAGVFRFYTDPGVLLYRGKDGPVVLSTTPSYICENGGTFVQDEPGVSTSGSCDCPHPYRGDRCQFSPHDTCGGGAVDENGRCLSCLPGHVLNTDGRCFPI